MLVKILSVVMIVISIAIVVLVLMQEGKSAGLGSISGAAESYWGKNKGRSIEGALEKATKVLVVVFFALAIFMTTKWF